MEPSVNAPLDLLLVLGYGLGFAALLWLNVAERKRRAELTPEQRRDEDYENTIW